MHEKRMRSKLEVTGVGNQPKGGMDSETSATARGEIMWVGDSERRRKLEHYSAFRINGVIVPLHSFCYIMIEKPEGNVRLVAYIIDLYEDKKSIKRMKVQWLHKAGEIQCRIPPPEPLANEVFMTEYFQPLLLECCDGLVDVLTPLHFEQCMRSVTSSQAHVYVCRRHFDKRRIKSFDVSSVCGYWGQKIFSSNLIPKFLTKIARANTDSDRSEQAGPANLDKTEQAGSVPVVISGPKAARSSRRRPVGRYDCMNNEGDWTSQQENCGVSCDTVDAVNSSMDKLLKSLPFRVTDSERASAGANEDYLGEVGSKVEILSQDSGLRGCWFRCTVMERRRYRVKVSYDDVLAVDTDQRVEEWISINNVDATDQPLGFRFQRQIVRPSPSEVERLSTHKRGCAVDAWIFDGWWEGIFTGRDASKKVMVTFPAEKFTALFGESEVRISREWVNGQWIDVQPHEDVINFCSGLHTERPFTDQVQESCPESKRILSPDFLSDIEAASRLLQSLPSDQGGEGNQPNQGNEDNPLDEGRGGSPSDEGASQQAAVEFQANNVVALHYERPFINQDLEITSEKVKKLFFNLKSATPPTAIQASKILESCEGMTLLNSSSKWSGKVTEANSAHHEDLDSDCVPPYTSENDQSSQNADQQLDVDRDKENNTVLVDRTYRGLGLISKSRKRPRDMGSSIFVRSTKSGFFPSRNHISNLFVNEPKEQEDLSLGVLTLSKLTEIGNVEVNRSQYGFEQVNSSTGASVGSPLFNSVSVQNLVLSR